MENVDFLNLQNIFYKIYLFIKDFDTSYLNGIIDRYWPILAKISFAISILIIFYIIYLYRKLEEVRKQDEEIYGKVISSVLTPESETENERWIRVLDFLDSESETDWKSAILEADIILDEMSVKMGYLGENLGERLRGVEKSDFITINQAWEAHKVRNAIAHEGSNYTLTKREVKRVIDLYRQVFEEFEFI